MKSGHIKAAMKETHKAVFRELLFGMWRDLSALIPS